MCLRSSPSAIRGAQALHSAQRRPLRALRTPPPDTCPELPHPRSPRLPAARGTEPPVSTPIPTSEAASTGRRVRAEPQAGVGGGAAAARAAKTNGARSSQPLLRASRNGRHLLMISKQGSKL